jgi:hypothetical protein
MRLREAFSSVFSFLVVVLRGGDQTSKPRISSTLSEVIPSSDKTDADGLAVAFVLTLEFPEIARLFVHLNHVASFIENANHSIM